MWGREERTNWDKLKDLIQDMEDEVGYDKDDLSSYRDEIEVNNKVIRGLMQEIDDLQNALNEANAALEQFGGLYAK